MEIINHLCVMFLFCVTAKAFSVGKNENKETERGQASTSRSIEVKEEAYNRLSPSTSSLLFKDTKPILTYILGQPKKQGGLYSPAQLLSPDRYEFFTFDDDGKIVKKLMSLKEIQKIIASNEKGSAGEYQIPIQYYEIISVTPDLGSVPSVSRINPNEPLFSIHDVITSVQNVLKSEIDTKDFQDLSNNNNSQSAIDSYHFETLTKKLGTRYEVSDMTNCTTQKTDLNENKNSALLSDNSEIKSSATHLSPIKLNETFLKGVDLTTQPEIVKTTEGLIFPETPRPLGITEPLTEDTAILIQDLKSTTKSWASQSTITQGETLPLSSLGHSPSETIMVPVVTQVAPMPLYDAHPAIISNESFLDIETIIFQENWKIEELGEEEENITTSKATTKNVYKTQILTGDLESNVGARPTSPPNIGGYTPSEHISITPDLANSVSSVLWQIASDNDLLDKTEKPTATTFISYPENIYQMPEKFSIPETQVQNVQSTSYFTTRSPGSMTTDQISENPIKVLESILPTNTMKNFTQTQNETNAESFSSTLAMHREISTISPTTKKEVKKTSLHTFKTDEKNINFTTGTTDSYERIASSTMSVDTFIVHVSTDPAFLSSELSTGMFNITRSNETTLSQAQENLEKVQITQEGYVDQILDYPDQIVKEIQRPEKIDIINADKNFPNTRLKDSTLTLPSSITTKATTMLEKSEEKTKEQLNESKNKSVQQTTPLVIISAEQQKDVLSSNKGPLTFVPMVIKTPSEGMNESNQTKADKKSADTENKTMPVNETDEWNGSRIESKNGELELTTVTNHKTPAVSLQSTSKLEEEIGTSKQNFILRPASGKPIAGFKPIKLRPLTDPRPTKPFTPLALVTLKPVAKEPTKTTETKRPYENHLQSSPYLVELEAAPAENLGLEATILNLGDDIKQFSDLCNELAFSLWSGITHNGMSFVRSIVVSPFAVSSLLAMVFLGARGLTSGQMNDILRLDDMVTFNPHLVFRNVTESLIISRNPGVATAAFVRELYSDKAKGKLLDFYKERAQQFYDGHVEEINFKSVGDVLRRQTNHLVKRQTWGKITDFLRGSNLMPRPPLAAFSANIFQTDCTKASTKDRDGEMYFVILPASRLRRLVPIPAVVWRNDFLAGYEPQLDATVAAIGPSNTVVSSIFILPGQQGLIAPGDTLARLEHHLLNSPYSKGHWSKLMRSLLPRPGLELQIPRLSHRSVINVTASLQRMGLRDLFNADKADLTGLNGLANDLHLSDMLQVNLFSTCGEEIIGSRHHSEIYPATPILRRDKSADFTESMDNPFAISDFDDPVISTLPLELRPRQARIPLSKPGAKIPEPPRLRFDRPFLFFVRHNPTGLILHMGRFNPRLMP